MDPLSVLGAVIAISQLAHAVKSSIEKVKGNKKRLEGLVDDIIRSLDDLEKFSKAHIVEAEGSPYLKAALSRLEHDISLLLVSCQKLEPRSDGSQISKVKASVKAWHKRDELEAEMSRIKDFLSSCYSRFTAFTAARVESLSYRMEKSIVVRGVEHQAHLQRLEVLVTNVLLDTRFGKHVVQQVARAISTNTYQNSIERDYLCLQVDKVLDTMETHPAYRGPVSESLGKEPTTFDPTYLPSVPHDFVVTGILVLARNLREPQSCLTIKPLILELETISYRLTELGMGMQALTAQKTIVQILRNLVGGGSTAFLPDLAHALTSLSVTFYNLGLTEPALIASEDSIAAFRLICETYPDLDFRPLLAMSLRTHGDALVSAWRDSEAEVYFQESIAIYVELVAEIQAGKRLADFTLFFSGSSVCLSYSQSLSRLGRNTEAYTTIKVSLYNLSLISKQDLDNYALWDRPSSIFEQFSTLLLSIYCPHEVTSLSLAGDAVTLYRQLATTDPKRFSSYFLRSLYAYTYLCHVGVSKEGDAVTLVSERAEGLRTILDQYSISSHAGHFLDFASFNPAIKRLQQTESGAQDITEAIYAYLHIEDENFIRNTPLAESVHRLVVSLSVACPDKALESVQRATDAILALQASQQPLLLRTLSLLHDASERCDKSSRSRFALQARSLLEYCRTSLHEVDVGQALVHYGYAMVHAGKENEGTGAIEEALDKYRSLLPESSTTRTECISCLKDYASFLHMSGETPRALELYSEAIELCIQSFSEQLHDATVTTLYVTILLQMCQYFQQLNLQGHANSLASCAYQSITSSPFIITPGEFTLNTVLIQCLRLSGRTEDAVGVASRAVMTMEGGSGSTIHIEAQSHISEHLIHWHALQGNQYAIQSILERAYTRLYKERMGSDIPPPTALGLRHDTLAVIASHYASADQSENILPFAKAAAQTYSKAHSRNAAEDMQYLESICDVAAFLWNSGKQDDATALLELVAQPQQDGSSFEVAGDQLTGPTPEIHLKAAVATAFDSENTKDDLQKCIAKYLSASKVPELDKDPADDVPDTVQKVIALVDRASKAYASLINQPGDGEVARIDAVSVHEADGRESPDDVASPPPYTTPKEDRSADPDASFLEIPETLHEEIKTSELEPDSPPSPKPKAMLCPSTSDMIQADTGPYSTWLAEVKHRVTLLANFLFVIWVLSNCFVFLSERFVHLLDRAIEFYRP